MTIKYPLRANCGKSGVWIDDGNGVTICDFNPLLVGENEELIFDLASEMAAAWNRSKVNDQTPFTDSLRAQLKKEQQGDEGGFSESEFLEWLKENADSTLEDFKRKKGIS